MSKVQLTLLDSQVVCKGRWYCSNSIYTRDGRVVFDARCRGLEEKNFYSPDGGKSWQVIEPVLGGFHYIECRNGSILGVGYGNEILSKIPRHQEYKPYIMAVRRAANFDALMAGEYEDDFVRVDIPELSGAYGDDSNFFCGTADHGVVELPNGDIIVNMYGHFRDDKTRITFFPTASYQYRTWNVVSRDGGRSFRYLATVADVQTWPVSEKAEGYCEADMKQLQDGRLLCVMRSGGAVHGDKKEYTPMYSCTSMDGGVTWSKPLYMYEYGVYPQLVQTQNGAVVTTAGRDGMYVIASADNGDSWQEPLFLTENVGPYGFAPSGYGSIGEVAPNEVVVLYDDNDPDNPMPEPGSDAAKDYIRGSCHRIIAQRIRVEVVD